MGLREDKFGELELTATALSTSLNNAATGTVDIDVTGFDQLYVIFQLLATTTTADLASAAVKPYQPNGTTLIQQTVPIQASVASASDGSNIVQTDVYNVKGLTKVRAQATNNNASAKTLVIFTYLGAAPVG